MYPTFSLTSSLLLNCQSMIRPVDVTFTILYPIEMLVDMFSKHSDVIKKNIPRLSLMSTMAVADPKVK